MYKNIALAALVLGSAALGFSMSGAGEDQFTLASSEEVVLFNDVVMDINMDGYSDQIRLQRINPFIAVEARMNTGNLTFDPWEPVLIFETIPDGGFSSLLQVMPAALDGDAAPDLIINLQTRSKFGDERVTYYLVNNGSGAFACTGDVTGDGATGVDDLLGVIADWGCVGEGLPD